MALGPIEVLTIVFPDSRFNGRIVPELLDQWPEAREILIDEYRLVYRIHAHHIEFITFFHGRRHFPF